MITTVIMMFVVFGALIYGGVFFFGWIVDKIRKAFF